MTKSAPATQRPLVIRSYSKRELTHLYGVSRRTMTTWLKPHLDKIGRREGRYYNVKQVTIIFNLLGLPLFKEAD